MRQLILGIGVRREGRGKGSKDRSLIPDTDGRISVFMAGSPPHLVHNLLYVSLKPLFLLWTLETTQMMEERRSLK